jgi:hypothetical protein
VEDSDLDNHAVTSVLIAAVLGWAIYRRARRSFGRQPVNIVRLRLRIGVLAVAAALILAVSATNVNLLAALLGGIACGAALATVGLRHTRFEATSAGRFYTPHTYIGLFISALFIGRILFRYLTLYGNPQAMAQARPNPFDQYHRSPLTVAIFGVLVGYYILFNLGVLRKSREMPVSASP